MNELVRFLLARIDDDEAQLKKIARHHARDGGPALVAGPYTLERLRAESESRRQLLGVIQQLLILRDQPQEKTVRDAAVQMLHALALPYAGHPAFPRM